MNPIQPDRLTALLAEATQAQEVADAKAAALAEALRQALIYRLPEGTVIDLRDRNLPIFIRTLKTEAGADRGTHVFRIVRVLGVSVRAATPTISQWACEAVPISEVTGKDMSATSGNRRSGVRTTVSLGGYLSRDLAGETVEAELARMVQTLVAEPLASSPWAPSAPIKAPRRPAR